MLQIYMSSARRRTGHIVMIVITQRHTQLVGKCGKCCKRWPLLVHKVIFLL